ncbi:MAG: DUF3810 family protein [Bacteroidia bacterium]|nr:DUF3810 family protein [Bacteroidia bacterium]
MPSAPAALPALDRRWVWTGLGLAALLLRQLLAANPYFTEVVYARGVFPLIRYAYDYTLGWLPVPVLYVAVAGLLLVLALRLRRRRRSGRSLRHRLGHLLLGMLAFSGAVVFWFLFLWGYNYQRRPIEAQLDLQPLQPDSVVLEREFRQVTAALAAARAAVPLADTAPLQAALRPAALEAELRRALADALADMGYPAPGRVRVRVLKPDGVLLRFGASGIYIPFVLEGHVDGALPAAFLPFTLAHEMAHGYGFGDEGVCNFLAWAACMRSAEPAVRYSGLLGYWRYLAADWRQLRPEGYGAFRDSLPAGVRADLRSLRQALERYPGWFPETGARVYSQYLRSQGVREGMASYSRMTALVLAYERKRGSPP